MTQLRIVGRLLGCPTTEYRTVYLKPPLPFPRMFSSSDNLHFQQQDARRLVADGEDAWVEQRTVTAWTRIDVPEGNRDVNES